MPIPAANIIKDGKHFLNTNYIILFFSHKWHLAVQIHALNGYKAIVDSNWHFPTLGHVVAAPILIWDKRKSQFNKAGDISSFTEIYTTLTRPLHKLHRIGLDKGDSLFGRFTLQWKFKVLFSHLVVKTFLSQTVWFHNLTPDWLSNFLSRGIPRVYTHT